MSNKPCPLQRKYGDIICIDGALWALTYSEMGPPDSRQYFGECEYCKRCSAIPNNAGEGEV
jgi:hypothetical protein